MFSVQIFLIFEVLPFTFCKEFKPRGWRWEGDKDGAWRKWTTLLSQIGQTDDSRSEMAKKVFRIKHDITLYFEKILKSFK